MSSITLASIKFSHIYKNNGFFAKLLKNKINKSYTKSMYI